MQHSIVCSKELMAKVKPIVDRTLAICEKTLPIEKSITIEVRPTEDEFILQKLGGTGGFAESARKIRLETNIQPRAWKYGLKTTVAHEYNHVVWLQLHGATYQNTSNLDWFVMEGLAQVFEEKIMGKKPSYAKAISAKDARKYWQQIRPKLGASSTELHEQIFFGKGGSYPRWTGYTTSYLLVKHRMKELGVGWPEIMRMDSNVLAPKDLKF